MKKAAKVTKVTKAPKKVAKVTKKVTTKTPVLKKGGAAKKAK